MTKATHRLSCHCGAIRITLYLPNGIEDPHRCNCSICEKRGAIASPVSLDGLEVVEGEDRLTLYQFNTFTAKHYFCSVCGTYTHHQRRSNPDQFSFNVACVEGFDVSGLGEVPVSDGINHPSDARG